MRKQFLRRGFLASSVILILSACGGGGGGSSPSTAAPQYINKPTVNCGSKDCFSGAEASSLSIGTSSVEGNAAYTSAKNEYDSVKGFFTDTGKVGYVVQLLNAAASENGISSCDDIPTDGTTFSFGGYTFTLSPSSEQWSLSGGMVTMTHQITGADANSNVQYNFNCDATVQRLHILTKDLGTGSKAEVYSERNLLTGETHIEIADDSSGKSLFYFSSNGGDKFTLAHLSNNGSSASSLLVTSDVLNPPQTDAASQYIEVVRSGASNADLDTADWDFTLHGNANAYRGCIMNYRSSSSATSYENSCNASTVAPPGDMGTKYARLSNLPNLLVGDGIAVSSWSVVGLNNLVIPNP